MTNTQISRLSSLIEKMMGYYSIPGMAIGILHDGRTEFLSFGYRNIEEKKVFTEKTISGVGSCSKSMTAMAVMRLASRGVLDIDKPIAQYIPGFQLWDRAAGEQITLRDMLCHRSGVAGHDGAWPDNSISRVDYLARLRYLEPNAPFRSIAQYSNVMYAAIGGIMEAVTGKKWEDILQEEIFAPLGMADTYCLMDDAAARDECAHPYRWDEGLHRLARWNMDQAGPCGSVMSTASDMAKWISCHMDGGRPLLDGDDFLEMHRPQLPMDYPHIIGGESLGYGFGWRVLDYHGVEVQQHTGKIEGYSAFQFYVPSLHAGAVYLQNLHCPDNPLIFSVQGYLLDAFLGREETDWFALYADPEKSHAPESAYHDLEFDCLPKYFEKSPMPRDLSAYEGVYENPGYGIFKIRRTEKGLVLDERAVTDLPMTHLTADTFAVHGVKEDTDLYKLPLTFISDDEGHVVGFEIPMEVKVGVIRFLRLEVSDQ